MNIEDCKKKGKAKKHFVITVRITKHLKQWLLKNEVSPTELFRVAARELGYRTLRELGELK